MGEAGEVGLPCEVKLGRYRIDVVAGRELIEIQHGSLAALRGKLAALLPQHAVRVIKPLIAHKQLIYRARRGGKVTRRRTSPKRQEFWHLFDELIYLVRLFPHPGLTVEALSVRVEEWRYPGHGRRRWRRGDDFQVEDQKLCEVLGSRSISTAADLCGLLPADLHEPFTTATLAAATGVPRGLAQRIAYCLRETGACRVAGKQGNALTYARLAA